MGFYEKYISTVIGNDSRTRDSVDAIVGRIDELLADRPDGRLSGLVVGRVQSGKTRNYVGLALKAAEAGWNVIITLTSPIMALAEQTEKRMTHDFRESGVGRRDAFKLNLLSDADNGDAEDLVEPGFFFWGVAMKQTTSLRRIAKWMTANKKVAHHMRVLVIDDEADNASPDSNAGKQKTDEQNEDMIQDVADAMEETDEKFSPLASWLRDLWMMDVPETDAGANTEEAKDCVLLKTLLSSSTKTSPAIVGEVLDSSVYTRLLGLDAHVVEDDELSDELSHLAREFFSESRGKRSPKTFVDVLKAVFSVAIGRSRINKTIISLVDKQDPEAQDYTYPFEKCAYIAYTATPYACILNERPDQTTIYPDFIYSLDKSPKYFGLDEIYGHDIHEAKARMDIVRSIPDIEEGGIIAPLVGSTYFMNIYGKRRLAAPCVRIEDDLTCFWDKGGVPSARIDCDEPDEESDEDDENDEDEEEVLTEIEWQTLRDSVAWAFCCAAARRWHRLNVYIPAVQAMDIEASEREDKLKAMSERWTTMLFNVSQKTSVHRKTAKILQKYIDLRLKDKDAYGVFVNECKALWQCETSRFDTTRFNEIFNSSEDTNENYGEVKAFPDWEEIVEYFGFFCQSKNRDIVVINSIGKESRENQIYYATGVRKMQTLGEDHLWFICGGNTIARGLTMEGLVASYFDRVKSKSVAVDTMTQMGRWFGYRIGYELLPRVWMTPYSVGEFKNTAIVEERMHESIRENFLAKASPCDRSSYQMVYYFGRKLSGRSRAMKKLDTGIGTFGSTNDISIVPSDVSAIHANLRKFLGVLERDYALSEAEQRNREAMCMYSRFPFWRNVPKATVANFIMDAADYSPENTRKMLRGLVREINSSHSELWDVVIAEPYGQADRDCYNIGIGREVGVGRPNANTVANGIANYTVPRLHMPYYADIPTRIINEADFNVLEENFDYIVSLIQRRKEKGAKLSGLEEVLSAYGNGDIRERLERFLKREGQPPFDKGMPDAIHGQFQGKLDGFRNRSSTEYLEKVHKLAENTKPILQVYLIEPPEEAQNLAEPLVAISFYWPAHEPTNFCAVTTGLEPRPPAPSLRKFYDAVEAVLKDWNFPMATKRLRNTVMERLGPGCTAHFFDTHIAKIPEGRRYKAVEERNAYVSLDWNDYDSTYEKISLNDRLAKALVWGAICYLRRDSSPHKSSDVFSTVLSDPKIGDFFSAGNPNDLAYFNSLFTEELLSNEGIAVVKRRPITWQYQG